MQSDLRNDEVEINERGMVFYKPIRCESFASADIIPFDAAGDHDGPGGGFHTPPALARLHGLADVEYAKQAGEVGNGVIGGLTRDELYESESDFAEIAALADRPSIVIEAPSGPMRIATGYFVYAVKLDEAGDVVMGQRVSGAAGMKFGAASILAQACSIHPPANLSFTPTHMIVNDGTGETFEPRYQVMPQAA